MPFAHEVIGKVGGEQRWVAGRMQAGGAVHFHVPQHGGHEARSSAHGVGGVKETFPCPPASHGYRSWADP